MKINVRVKPFSREEKIIQSEDGKLTIWVKEGPFEGRANKAVIKMISRHFRIPQSKISIVCGHKNRNKIIEIK